MWEWNRELFDREYDIIDDLCGIINRFPIKQGMKDGWRWKGSKDGRFKASKSYEILMTVRQIGWIPVREKSSS